MHILVKVKFLLDLSLCLVFLLNLTPVIATGEVESSVRIDKKLAELSDEENEVLQSLFFMDQEINAMENTEESLTSEIESIKKEITYYKDLIREEEYAHNKNQKILEQLLQSYQRMGPGSYLQIILESENLTTLLRRVNALRDLTRNTGEILEALDESKRALTLKKGELLDSLALQEKKQEDLRKALADKYKLKFNREGYLASLKKERGYAEDSLAEMQKTWADLKRLFPEISEEFLHILEAGDLPSDGLRVSFSLFSIKGIIGDKTLNNMIAKNTSLAPVLLSFNQGAITLEIPDKKLVLTGNFIIQDEKALVFEAEKGSFYGMPLEKEMLEDLFREGFIVLDISPLLGDNRLGSAKALDGELELTIIPVLFRR